ncbi:endo-1,4-beta-xylanase [Fusarium oxysporum f. sp. raphani 54005]|uniref:Beta-xylanase n=3 Tax=Fusarium oxysporum TaxID=5507 RepID=X0CCB2_FUSOX|nr:endo-1,4-beta-xylanase [Fusarium oxysporum f. sp. pisi HDV247]EXK88853.1 endo-1,4-beta-xylanase [Fusarium oxysporum f. sp. raphani 54005]KAG7426793.1 Endo-1,4-beta-xylanase 1 [Fusarium oxysporum f. sp. raphani]
MHKTTLLGLLASSPVSAQLHSLAQAAGLKYFGSAVDNGYLSDAPYSKLADDVEEFGQLVPENGQKWETVEPKQGDFVYTTADVVPDLAKKNGQILRCHALTWHSQLPTWVSSGAFSAEKLTEVIEAHIANVVEHYKGDCYAWDVVNEAIDDNAEWRDSVFSRTLGTDFLGISFKAARKADPAAKLYYNDYNLEQNGAKTDKAVELVKLLQKEGAPIDGVGFQGHLIVGQTPSRSELAATFKRFTDLNVEVAITELDIRHESVPASAAELKTQGDEYADVVGACLDTKGCVGVTVWGITDKYSWIPGVFEGNGEALLYTDDYEKKPAWTSVSSLLAAAATKAPATSSVAPVETTAPATTLETKTKPVYTVPGTTNYMNTTAPQTEQTRTALATETDDNDDDCAETEAPFPTYAIPTNGTQVYPTKAPVDDDSDDDCAETEAPIPTQAPVPSGDCDEDDGEFEPTVAAIEPTTRVPVIRSSSAYTYKWNTETTAPQVPAPTGTAPAYPVGTGSGGVVKHYYQCGGKNYKGPTECEKPYKCVEHNEYYFQCV